MLTSVRDQTPSMLFILDFETDNTVNHLESHLSVKNRRLSDLRDSRFHGMELGKSST